MRLRKVKHAETLIAMNPSWVTTNPVSFRGQWQSVFPHKRPIHLEVGSGKGKFILEMATTFPDINFIALEKQNSVLIRALEKLLINSKENVRLILGDAKEVHQFFAPGEIMTIYLNFSDPWPKRRQEKRRLTHPEYLARYRDILGIHGKLILKTDNDRFFSYSLMQINGDDHFRIDRMSLDLEQTSWFNIATEFEERFRSQGNPIYYLEATLIKGDNHERTLSGTR